MSDELDDMTKTERCALLVNLASTVVLDRLPTQFQRLAQLRFHRLGPQYSRAMVSEIIYGDRNHLETVRRNEVRLWRQLWRYYKGYPPPTHAPSRNRSWEVLSGCRGCGRLLRAPVSRLTLPSAAHAICQPCVDAGIHPLRLFPDPHYGNKVSN